MTRQPGNVLKKVETSGGGGGSGEGRVLQFQVTGMIEWGRVVIKSRGLGIFPGY